MGEAVQPLRGRQESQTHEIPPRPQGLSWGRFHHWPLGGASAEASGPAARLWRCSGPRGSKRPSASQAVTSPSGHLGKYARGGAQPQLWGTARQGARGPLHATRRRLTGHKPGGGVEGDPQPPARRCPHRDSRHLCGWWGSGGAGGELLQIQAQKTRQVTPSGTAGGSCTVLLPSVPAVAALFPSCFSGGGGKNEGRRCTDADNSWVGRHHSGRALRQGRGGRLQTPAVGMPRGSSGRGGRLRSGWCG